MNAIFLWYQLDNPDFSIEEKGSAILEIMNMETHNSFPKKDFARVIEWLILSVMNFTQFKPMAPYHAKSLILEKDFNVNPEYIQLSAIMTVIMHRGYAGMSKDDLLEVLRWCWNKCFEVQKK